MFITLSSLKKMFKKKKAPNTDFDILSSIWILSSNDENPQITYQGIIYRLGLSPDYDIKNLIHSHAELFRKTTTPNQLRNWKGDMIIGKRLPSWIENFADPQERIKSINALTVNDVFRSQFRSKENSPKSEIEIIQWGLEHINKLRDASLENRKERTRVFTTVWIPALSTLIGIVAVLSSFYVQYSNNKSQIELKHYEVEMRPKQIAYADFMKYASQAFYTSMQHNREQLNQNLDRLEISFYSIDPFISEYDRNRIWEQYQQFSGLCFSVVETDSLGESKKALDSYIWYRNFFRDNLYHALFADAKNTKK